VATTLRRLGSDRGTRDGAIEVWDSDGTGDDGGDGDGGDDDDDDDDGDDAGDGDADADGGNSIALLALVSAAWSFDELTRPLDVGTTAAGGSVR